MELPGVSSANGFSSKWDDETCTFLCNYVTREHLPIRSPVTGGSDTYRTPEMRLPDAAGFESKQVFLHLEDGTQINAFPTRREWNSMGTIHSALYSYGGFNISLTPRFSISNVVWMEQGGIYAVANLRGGGEYGEQWHSAGTQMNKQNVLAVCCSCWIPHLRAVHPEEKLAIAGRLNGGLLLGLHDPATRCLKWLCRLFGVLDEQGTTPLPLVQAGLYDYGTSDDSKREMFEYWGPIRPTTHWRRGGISRHHGHDCGWRRSGWFCARFQFAAACKNTLAEIRRFWSVSRPMPATEQRKPPQ